MLCHLSFALCEYTCYSFPKLYKSEVIIVNKGLSSQEFYCWAKDAAISLTDKIVGCNASLSEDKICSSAMRLMFEILNWNFRQSTVHPDHVNFKPNEFSAGIRQEAILLKKFERIFVQVDQSTLCIHFKLLCISSI